MRKQHKEILIEENDYFLYCLLKQLVTNDNKINKEINKLLKLLENKIFKDINECTNDIKDFKLVLKLFY